MGKMRLNEGNEEKVSKGGKGQPNKTGHMRKLGGGKKR